MSKERNYAKQPITVDEAIALFQAESFDLVMAKYEVVMLASDKHSPDILARWEDYQEEMRCLLAELGV